MRRPTGTATTRRLTRTATRPAGTPATGPACTPAGTSDRVAITRTRDATFGRRPRARPRVLPRAQRLPHTGHSHAARAPEAPTCTPARTTRISRPCARRVTAVDLPACRAVSRASPAWGVVPGWPAPRPALPTAGRARQVERPAVHPRPGRRCTPRPGRRHDRRPEAHPGGRHREESR